MGIFCRRKFRQWRQWGPWIRGLGSCSTWWPSWIWNGSICWWWGWFRLVFGTLFQPDQNQITKSALGVASEGVSGLITCSAIYEGLRPIFLWFVLTESNQLALKNSQRNKTDFIGFRVIHAIAPRMIDWWTWSDNSSWSSLENLKSKRNYVKKKNGWEFKGNLSMERKSLWFSHSMSPLNTLNELWFLELESEASPFDQRLKKAAK